MKKLLTFLLVCLPFLLKAQTNTSLDYLHVTAHIGPFVSGLPNSLEETMKSQGYQPHSRGLFGGGGPLPMSRHDPVFQLGIEKITQHSWSVKLLVSTLQGHVSGISSQEGDLRMNYKMVTSAFLAGYHSKQRITRIAVGPALHFISLEGDRESIFSDPIKKRFTKIGMTIEAGLRFPAASRLFFDYHSQYHLVGKQDMGSYNFEEVNPGGQVHTTSFTAGKESCNYVTFNFGIGVRLGNLPK